MSGWLPVGQPMEVLLLHVAREPPLPRELAVPLAANLVALRVVVLAGVAELLRVVRADLRGTQGLGDGEHGAVRYPEEVGPSA